MIRPSHTLCFEPFFVSYVITLKSLISDKDSISTNFYDKYTQMSAMDQ